MAGLDRAQQLPLSTLCKTPQMAAAAALDQRRGGGMTDDLHSQVPRREGESQEHYESRLRFLERVSDWGEDDYPKINRDGELVEPDHAGDEVELDDAGRGAVRR